MTDALSQTLEPRCQEILRRTAIALKGRGVGVWEADARGRPRLLAVSSAEDVAPVAADELEALLREVGELPAAGRPPRRWLASRLEGQRWCIAPVRTEPPQPPPAGVERRGPERLTLELAGVCIGLIERQLSEEPMAQFKAMVDSADDAVIGKTLDGVITSWNPAATRLYGYTAEEVIGKPIALLAPPDHIDELPRILERVRRGERIEHHETTRVRKDGARIEVSLSISPILDAQGRPVGATAIAYDVTARKQAEQQLAHGALHDALTDLPNRAYFVERVTQAQARVRRDPDYRFAVLFIDSDKFKAVNDNLGHGAGDRLLTEIAGRLRTCVRPGDVVARLGGDEFAVLLEDIVGPADAEHAARRIQDALAAPVAFEGREIVATASVGVALSRPGYTESQDLLHDADLAMYHAKQQGGARFRVFDVIMRESAQARASMEADLRNALERQEFRLVFHPIVELHTGRVHGFEALLRWHHPERGVIPPLEFVPLAEETGLILPIGAWVIAEACRYGRRWQDAFPAAGPLP